MVGAAIGVASFTAPLNISEVSPVNVRGRLVSINQLGLTSGIVLSYLVDYALAGVRGWGWMFGLAAMPAGKLLRVETLEPARVHWSADGWATIHDTVTRDTRLGLYVVDLPTDRIPAGAKIAFTFFWPQAGRWEGNDFTVQVG